MNLLENLISIDFKKCMRWLYYFKQCGNPYFQDVRLPKTYQESITAETEIKTLHQQIISEENIVICEDSYANKIESTINKTSTSVQVNPDTKKPSLTNVMLSDIPHKTKIEKSVFQSIHDAITPDQNSLTEEGSKIFQTKSTSFFREKYYLYC